MCAARTKDLHFFGTMEKCKTTPTFNKKAYLCHTLPDWELDTLLPFTNPLVDTLVDKGKVVFWLFPWLAQFMPTCDVFDSLIIVRSPWRNQHSLDWFFLFVNALWRQVSLPFVLWEKSPVCILIWLKMKHIIVTRLFKKSTTFLEFLISFQKRFFHKNERLRFFLFSPTR